MVLTRETITKAVEALYVEADGFVGICLHPGWLICDPWCVEYTLADRRKRRRMRRNKGKMREAVEAEVL